MRTVLETQRLILRWLEPKDGAFILALHSEPLWRRFIGDRGVTSLPTACNYIASIHRDSYLRHGIGLWAMQRKADGAAVGLCGLLKRDALEHVDIGFALLERHAGAGLAREAAAATLAYGLDTLGVARVAAVTVPENQRCVWLLTRLGLTLQGEVSFPGESRPLQYFLTPERT